MLFLVPNTMDHQLERLVVEMFHIFNFIFVRPCHFHRKSRINIIYFHRLMKCVLIFLISRYLRHEQDCSEITVQSLARLFVPVILIRLFFKQWFTYFCDIYVFLVQFRI